MPKWVKLGFLVVSAITLAGLLGACDDGLVIDVDERDGIRGNGSVVTESRTIEEFERFTLAGEGTALVVEAGEVSLTIEGEENLLGFITTEVSAGSLVIGTKPGIDLDPTEPIVYRVSAPDITELVLTGAGVIRMDEIEADGLAIRLSGAGTIVLEAVDVDELTVAVPGAGRIELEGEARSQDVTIAGVGTYDAEDLETETATIVASGVGSATVWVTDELVATLTGVGGINYYGSPNVAQTVSGVGSIRALGDR